MSVTTQPNQESFNAGEFGERMSGRVQFGKYQNAGAQYENILPLPQGGFTYRPGSRFISEARASTERAFLIPFIFSTVQSYILDLSEQRMRFFKDQAIIVGDGATTSTTINNGQFTDNLVGWTTRTGTVTHQSSSSDVPTSAKLADGAAFYQSFDYDGATVSAPKTVVIGFTISGDPGDTLTVRCGTSAGASNLMADTERKVGYHLISFDVTQDHTAAGGDPIFLEFANGFGKAVYIEDVFLYNGTAIELHTPYTEANQPDISYAQSADVMYMAIGGSTHVYRLDRFGHSSWSLTEVLFTDGPFLDQNITSTTVSAASATGKGITLTASAVTGINDGAGFRNTDIGRLIRAKNSSNKQAYAMITARASTTSVAIDILSPDGFPTSGTTDWRLGEWNDEDGWPSVGSFVQQRRALAATTVDPQKFWLSASADLENFADTDVDGDVLDDSAINYRFASRSVNNIFWVASRKKPIIGTLGGNWTLRSEGSVLTPTDIVADFEVSSGCARIPPVEVRSRLVFAQRQERKLVEFADVIQSNGLEGFDAFDLTLLNDRVLTSGVVQLSYQQEPDSIIWCVREDGQLAALTYQPDQDVVGWSRHIIGGSFQGGDAVVESVAVIPGANGAGQFKDSTGRDEVWISVKREINGSTKRYIECLEKTFNADEDLQEDAFYVDSGLTLDAPFTITAITKANPGVVTTAAAHGFSNGDEVRIVRVKGMTEVNNTSFLVAGVTSTTFQLQDLDSTNVNTTSHTTYSTGGEVRKKVSSISGLTHLEGQAVQVFADGAIQTAKTVSSGAITLDTAASQVHVGLSATRKFKSLKLAFGGRDGSAVGKPKSIADVILVLMEAGEGSLTLKTIEDGVESVASTLDLRQATDIDADPVSFFTGEIRLGVTAGFDEDIRLLLEGNQPTPATVLALSPEVDTSS